ncbi:MAG: TIGR00266 family protein [Oscillospiraceae bacterium]|nr:TIGR00266 family protein [Oscillospiraceae bacterium]
MQYEIFGGNLPAVTVSLENGESIYTQSGGMTWMSADINMETNMKGGFMRGLGRALMGDSLFMATYTATGSGQSITFASTFPGNIVMLDLAQGPYVIQRSAFLCAQPDVELKMYAGHSWKAGLFSGEGLVMQELSGSGTAFLEIDGSVKEIDLAPGEKLKVDTGNVAAFEQRVKFSAEMVKGFKNILFGGEGLFLTTLEGPGKVWLQTMTASGLASKLVPFMPFKKDD